MQPEGSLQYLQELANSRLAGQEIIHFLWNPEFHRCVLTGPYPELILIHIFIPCPCNIPFILSSHIHLGF